MTSPSPRARRPINPGTGPVPPRAGRNQRALRRTRFAVAFGALLLVTLIMIAISLAF